MNLVLYIARHKEGFKQAVKQIDTINNSECNDLEGVGFF